MTIAQKTLETSANIAVNPVPITTLKASSSTDIALQLIQVLGSLGLVIALVFLVAYMVKRNQGFSQINRKMRIVERLSVGTKEQVLLIAVNGQELLLGVSAAGVSTLHAFTAGAEVPASNEGSSVETTPKEASTLGFSAHLSQILAARIAS